MKPDACSLKFLQLFGKEFNTMISHKYSCLNVQRNTQLFTHYQTVGSSSSNQQSKLL